MKKSTIGGQAVMEGVMMKSPTGMALCVRKSDGTIAKEYRPYQSKAKKGSILGFPIIRGVVAFVESLKLGMQTTTRSVEMLGIEEEPTKFDKWLEKKFGKAVDKIVMGIAVLIAAIISVGLFVALPLFLSDIIFPEDTPYFWVKLTEGGIRLLIFFGYLLLCTTMKDIKRVFMYHGAEHKTIACYEAGEELTPENAAKHKRLHPRCGTNYLFLVMAVSILFFSVVGKIGDVFILQFLIRLALVPVVAGFSYEVLMFAAKHENVFTRIIRAPGMALQYITTKEPTEDMLEVAIASFNIALDPESVNEPEVGEPQAEMPQTEAPEETLPDTERAAEGE